MQLVKNKRIAFIIPYPHESAPGQRFRFEQYLGILESKNFRFKLYPFLSSKAYKILYDKSQIVLKATYFIQGYILRLLLIFKIWRYDFVFIFREATPAGPPFFEFIVSKILKKKVIYDFDDAIWLEDPIEKGTLLAKIKWKKKVSSICKWSHKISAGNKYLAEFAKKFNKNVVVLPTTIDTESLHNPKLHQRPLKEKITIGWTGTHSTLQYLNPLIPALKALEGRYNLEFIVIANKNPEFSLHSFRFIPWKKDTEIEDLMEFNIGLMPLTVDEWSKGKCGFKLLQYMALEIPAIASPVGVNMEIVKDGENGYIASTPEEFADKIEILLKNKLLREKMGIKGRQTVVSSYSVEANTGLFLSLFE